MKRLSPFLLLSLLPACEETAPPPPPCFLSADQAARLSTSSDPSSSSVLSGDLGAGCVTLPFEYAIDPGRREAGTLALSDDDATLTLTGLQTDSNTGEILSGDAQARLTLTATFPVPLAPGAEATEAFAVRRDLADDGTVRELRSEPGAVNATLTGFDAATGRVEGQLTGNVPYISNLSEDFGQVYYEPYYGGFDATVAVTGQP